MILTYKKKIPGSLYLILVVLFSLFGFLYAEDKVSYNPKNKRDPFLPLITPEGLFLETDETEGGISELRLEGIIYDPEGLSYAMINGLVLKVGDSIAGYEVLKIEPQKVRLIKGAQTTDLELKKED